MSVRTAEAHWEGDLKNGNGTMRFGNGAFEGAYGFRSRFEEGPGTNPEELIGAAHAGCFSMAFSNMLAKAGHVPTSVDTAARVHLETVDGAATITRVELDTRGRVPGIDQAEFAKIAAEAKANCPVSRALGGVDISVQATLLDD